MTNGTRFFALALLLANTIGALFGGASLMLDPSGRSLHLPTEYLQHTTLSDFFIPGLILFMVNGVYGLIVSLFTLLQGKPYPLLIFYQGILLCEWIVVQVLLLNLLNVMHVLMVGIGALMMVLGLILYRAEKTVYKKY